ncbi:MAG TPA: nicotinate-nucleotide adenylyltransferase [Candidatus Dormibacteraeota bacterium]|nr:nicotinate-nucleotide adenylyltransferase [Candidatus Dormibacteraeota bacterium]
MRTGILGGTFDPIHEGHLAAARVAMDCARLDRVLFIPGAQPPHRGPAVASSDQRLEMSRLAIATEPRFEVSDIEVRRGGKSYTADTVRQLRQLYPSDELFLILGWDAARLFRSWREPDVIRRLVTVVVVTRPGTPDPEAKLLQAAGLDPGGTLLCSGHTPDISGSALREAIATGKTVSNSLPPAVERYVAEHSLYRDNR